jgi:hypothetical protein
MTNKYSSIRIALLLSVGAYVYGAVDNSAKAGLKSVRALDYKSIPSDAEMHHRTKWSNDVFIYVDYDPGAPSLYVFDRSGEPRFSAMIQLPEADRIHVDDFAAATDGSIWAGGGAISRSGQESFFLI